MKPPIFKLSLLALALSTSSVIAQDVSLIVSWEKVRTALDRGYGAMCSLTMETVENGGYYRCLDIGPYRFVEEYGRTRAFVLVDSQPPFEIAIGTSSGVHFTQRGPWTEDLAGRIDQWYAYEVEGGRAAQNALEQENARIESARDAVDAYLQSLNPQPEDPEEPAQTQPSQPTPQVYYIVPPNYGLPQQPQVVPGQPIQQNGEEIPLSGVPFPTIAPQAGGVTIAPGVVAYPDGTPTP